MCDFIFRELELGECERIKEIDASQYIKRAWREVDGKRQLIDLDYHDPDWPNGYDEHLEGLKNTIKNGGSAIGVFDEDRLIGFSTLDREVFGEKYKHVLLDQMFISLDYRGEGIGKKLFEFAKNTAKKWNVDKIYICAGSAEDTIAFYKSVGCIEAEEINQELYEDDPRDLQLEFVL